MLRRGSRYYQATVGAASQAVMQLRSSHPLTPQASSSSSPLLCGERDVAGTSWLFASCHRRLRGYTREVDNADSPQCPLGPTAGLCSRLDGGKLVLHPHTSVVQGSWSGGIEARRACGTVREKGTHWAHGNKIAVKPRLTSSIVSVEELMRLRPGVDSVPAGQLNRQLRKDPNPATLIRLIIRWHKVFDAVHVATALTRLAHFWTKRAIPSHLVPSVQKSGVLLRQRLQHMATVQQNGETPIITQLQPRVLANALYALARLWLLLDEPFLDAVCCHVAGQAGAFRPQELAMVVWAFGRMRVTGHDDVTTALGLQVVERAATLSDYSLANVAMAFADLPSPPPPALFPAISGHVTQRTAGMSFTSLSKLVRAYARLGLRNPPHLAMHEAIAGEMATRAPEANLYDVKMLLAGWSELGFAHDGALRVLRQRLAVWVEEITPDQVTPLLWAYAQLAPFSMEQHHQQQGQEEHESGVHASLPRLAAQLAHLLTTEELSLTALALAVLLPGEEGRNLLSTHFAPFLSYQSFLTKKQYTRLFEVELAYASSEEEPVLLAQPGYGIARRVWLEALAEGQQADDGDLLREEVHHTLQSLGVDSEVAWRTDDGMLPVDVMLFLEPHGKQVPLQVDGRSRLTCSAPHRLLGLHLLRDRVLRQRCPVFLRVPFHEWEQLRGEADRAAYLQAKLQSVS